MEADDWPTVHAIYAAGIATRNATFETEPPSWMHFDGSHLEALRFVATSEATVVGWAAASPVSDRCAYRGVAEHSVYVDPSATRQGVGARLLHHLVDASERAGIWTLQSGVFPENAASLALHRRCGFRVVGRRERLGVLDGIWRDVVFIERRSREVGATPEPTL
jgi:L-amino acid N-acyltransferase YncA